MILLSYTTLNELILEPHTWLCKQMGLPRWTTDAMNEGKEAHKAIQGHVSGKLLDPRLKDLTVKFPIVEERDQDPRTHFLIKIDDEYSVHGYLDGIDPENKRFLEIKSSSTPWGIAKFYNLVQWKIYALSGDYQEAVFVTCTRDVRKVAKYSTPILPKHRDEAIAFIKKGIAIIESGDFSYKSSGRSRYCNYIGCPYCN